MPSFYVRNLARYFAVSQMEKMSRPSTPQTPDEVTEGVSAWNKICVGSSPLYRLQATAS